MITVCDEGVGRTTLIVASTFEQAMLAARKLGIEYNRNLFGPSWRWCMTRESLQGYDERCRYVHVEPSLTTGIDFELWFEAILELNRIEYLGGEVELVTT